MPLGTSRLHLPLTCPGLWGPGAPGAALLTGGFRGPLGEVPPDAVELGRDAFGKAPQAGLRVAVVVGEGVRSRPSCQQEGRKPDAAW